MSNDGQAEKNGFIGGERAEDGENFMLEMPVLRVPSLKNVFAALKEKTLDFIAKAGTVIFAVSIALWVLKSFGLNGYCPENPEKSFLYLIGNVLKYPFYPLGFGSCEASVAVVTGLLAKEAVIETLTLVCGSSAAAVGLFSNGFSVYAFIAFVLLMPPCAATLAVAKKELKSGRKFAFMIVFESAAAYLVALTINFIGVAITSSLSLIIRYVFVIMIAITFFSRAQAASRAAVVTAKGKGVAKNAGKENAIRFDERSGQNRGGRVFSRGNNRYQIFERRIF